MSKRIFLFGVILTFVSLKTEAQYKYESEVKFDIPQIKKIIDISREQSSKLNYVRGYRIQIFSGNHKEFKMEEEKFTRKFPDAKMIKKIENPFYKIWVGAFRDKFQADYELKKYSKIFTSAVIIPDDIFLHEI